MQTIKKFKNKLNRKRGRKSKNQNNKKNTGKFESFRDKFRKPKRSVFLLAFGFISIVFIGWIGYFGFLFFSLDFSSVDGSDIRSDWDGISRFNTLLIGVDEQPNGYIFVDFLALIEVNPTQKEIRILNLNTLFSPYYASNDDFRTLKNAFAIEASDTGDIDMYSFKLDVQRIIASKVDSYVFVSDEGFEEIFKSTGSVNISAPSTVVDPDLPGFSIKESNTITFDDYIEFVSADDNGQDDKMARQLSALQSLIHDTSLIRFLVNYPEKIGNIQKNIKTDLRKRDMLKLIYHLRFKGDMDYNVVFVKFHPGYKVKTALGEVWRPVFENVDQDIGKLFIDNDARIEQATVDVLNSTRQSGLGSVRSRWLENRGLRIVIVGNSQKELPITTIYTSDPEKFPNTIREIQETFYGEVVIEPREYPDRSVGDIVVVIGANEIIKRPEEEGEISN